ncbi:hypothetical protein C5167_032868, partial [Papaver somniferum]
MWLCTKCMLLRAWSKCCRPHQGDIISAPLNGREADSLIQGIPKPLAEVVALFVPRPVGDFLQICLGYFLLHRLL